MALVDDEFSDFIEPGNFHPSKFELLLARELYFFHFFVKAYQLANLIDQMCKKLEFRIYSLNLERISELLDL